MTIEYPVNRHGPCQQQERRVGPKDIMALLRATTRSSGYRTAASRRGETVATCYIVLPTSAQSARAARKQQQWREIDGVIAELRR